MLTSNNVILQMFHRLIKCSKYICYKASNCPAKVKIQHQEDTCRGTHLENHMNWSFELRIMYETLSSYVCLHVVYADIALTACSSWSSHELTSSQKPSTGMGQVYSLAVDYWDNSGAYYTLRTPLSICKLVICLVAGHTPKWFGALSEGKWFHKQT